MGAGLRRWHAHDSEERREVDLAPALVPADSTIHVELPAKQDAVRDEPEPLVHRRRPGGRPAPAPAPWGDTVDRDLERLSGASATDLDRPDQRVTGVELLVARLELRPRLDVPAGVERRERDRVPGVDREHGLEVAREVPVQRPPLERDLVDGHQASRSARPS